MPWLFHGNAQYLQLQKQLEVDGFTTEIMQGYQVAAALAGFGPMMWTPMVEKFGPSPWVFGGF
ncbi:hypothetical protein [Peribacillus cavernae]|uniref:hypothetical protein n=1 Tax=Peribacillus cavernae TaxID=1674310 RepID=UPI00163BA67B|nr:hypothetical protein [Peribacillus cavernae]MDQ0219425.1 hypothetical protein [Peribacillus cavernae]